MKKSLRPCMMSEKMDWETPPEILAELRRFYGEFSLDPAASPENAVAKKYFTEAEDGLKQDWLAAGRGGWIFVNPPYGREVKAWVEKTFGEWRKGAKIIMLLAARTDTSWFHDWIWGFAEIIFIRGRLKFVGAKNSAPFPSMLVIYR